MSGEVELLMRQAFQFGALWAVYFMQVTVYEYWIIYSEQSKQEVPFYILTNKECESV